MSIPWIQGHCYAFPPFCLISCMLSKTLQDQVHTVTLITPCCQTQLWYPQVLGMLMRRPILKVSLSTLLVDSKGNPHPFALNKTVTLVGWQVFFRDYLLGSFWGNNLAYCQVKKVKCFVKLKISPEEVILLVWLMENWPISIPCGLCVTVFKLIILVWKTLMQNKMFT